MRINLARRTGESGRVRLGQSAWKGHENEKVTLEVRNGANILCLAAPRYGKGALCKNIAVQISKFKKVCIFDYRGEWSRQVTQYNQYSSNPEKLTDCFIARNFVFTISEFSSMGDWVGLGMTQEEAFVMSKIVNSAYHGNDMGKVKEMIAAIPIKMDEVEKFNEDYGVDLIVTVNFNTRAALGTRFGVLQRLFWQGPDDERQILNFRKIWLDFKNLIVDMTDYYFGFKDKFRANAYAGLILRKMKPTFEVTQGFYVVEEASQLLGNIGSQNGVENWSSVPEFHKIVLDLLTLAPKQGVNLLLLAQSKRQVYQELLPYISVFLVGRLNPMDELTEHEKRFNASIFLRPGVKRREWWLWDTFYQLDFKFVAAEPCCEYETNL